jgi:ribosomal peptide maturation radical SAM protein 1
LPVLGNGSQASGPVHASVALPVALVNMPWGAIDRPSVAMATLKGTVEQTGCIPHLHYLNIQFAHQLGLDIYTRIADGAYVYPEWFFAPATFGPQGTGELQGGWAEMAVEPRAAGLIHELRSITGDSPELCSRIANEDVPRFMDRCLEEIPWGDYAVIGFTTTFAQSLASLCLSRLIRLRFPKVKIVMGGANTESEMGVEMIRGCDWIDYVVHGEAEESFPLLLREIAAGRDEIVLPGVSSRVAGEVMRGDESARPVEDLNQIPVPDYTEYLSELNRHGFRTAFAPQLFYESSRGCWWGAKHHCTFCGLNGGTMAYRSKSPSRVYSEVMEMATRYKILRLAAVDNILAMEYFSELLPRLAEQDIDLSLFYEVKANLNREQLQKLAAAGVHEIQPGIESFNTRLLRLIDKGVTGIQNVQILKWCRELDIRPSWNILYALPGETAEDYRGLDRLLRTLFHLHPPAGMGPVRYERFSPYFTRADSFGLELEPNRCYEFIFPQSRMQLSKIAYYFEGIAAGRSDDPEEYTAEAREAVKQWTSSWAERPAICFYEKGPGFVTIFDTRPLDAEKPVTTRRIRLDGQLAEIYLYCDEIRARATIGEKLRREHGYAISEQSIDLALERLTTAGLVHREGERYISLATRKAHTVSRRQSRAKTIADAAVPALSSSAQNDRLHPRSATAAPVEEFALME